MEAMRDGAPSRRSDARFRASPRRRGCGATSSPTARKSIASATIFCENNGPRPERPAPEQEAQPMKSIKGPAIFLAQFAGAEPPFNNFATICEWAASLGYKGVQIPAWDARFIDLEKAAGSVGYCQELIGVAASRGVEITELATHLQGQLV